MNWVAAGAVVLLILVVGYIYWVRKDVDSWYDEYVKRLWKNTKGDDNGNL